MLVSEERSAGETDLLDSDVIISNCLTVDFCAYCSGGIDRTERSGEAGFSSIRSAASIDPCHAKFQNVLLGAARRFPAPVKGSGFPPVA